MVKKGPKGTELTKLTLVNLVARLYCEPGLPSLGLRTVSTKKAWLF